MAPVLETRKFPACRFASDEVLVGTRCCGHPSLRGLKAVTAELCSGCFYREASASTGNAELQSDLSRTVTAAEQQIWDCAYLATTAVSQPEVPDGGTDFRTPQFTSDVHSTESWLDTAHVCRHPHYQQTSRRHCATCSDYLFPRFSPRMSVNDAQRLLAVQRGPQPHYWWTWPNVQQAFREQADAAIQACSPYPGSFKGRGIVIAGGGRYLPSAYVTIRVLRQVGCQLPIQLWHFTGEVDDLTRTVLEPWNVECVNGEELGRHRGDPFHPTWWKGWQLKPYAILHAPFEEVLFLDADSYPTRNPEFLFDWSGYRQRGAVFWPDIDGSSCLLTADRPPIFGVTAFHDRPTESGQLLIHKRTCWHELNLAWFYNAQAEFTYRNLWGDKDTFPMAWKKLGREYARMWPTANANNQAVLQFDDAGCVLFQHRAKDKFRLPGSRFESNQQRPGVNQYNPALIHEDFCFAVLEELRQRLSCAENS